MDLTPTIKLLEARRDALAAALTQLRLFPRLEEQLADEIAAKETRLASHQEAITILLEHQATHPARAPEGRLPQAGVSTPDQHTPGAPEGRFS